MMNCDDFDSIITCQVVSVNPAADLVGFTNKLQDLDLRLQLFSVCEERYNTNCSYLRTRCSGCWWLREKETLLKHRRKKTERSNIKVMKERNDMCLEMNV